MPLDVTDAVLARYPAIARPIGPVEPLGNAGGSSGSRLWRYRSGRGPLVLRSWPLDGPPPDALRRIHGWLSTARALGFIPVPIPDHDGETLPQIAGRSWEVVPWMPGAACQDRPPTPARIRAAFVALASFHQVLAGTVAGVGPSPGLAARLDEIAALSRGGFGVLRDAVARAGADPRRERARAWLDLAPRVADACREPLRRAAGRDYRIQPCLRDARPDHLLFEGDRVTGLIDFGAMGIEVVSADLARLLADWFGHDRTARGEALAAYASIRPLDEAETALIDVFERSSALLGAGHWIRWHFVEGRVFDDPRAVLRGIDRGLERLARLAAGGPG